MTKITKENIAKACEKLVRSPDFRNLTINDLQDWAKSSERLEKLLEFAESLPQKKMIAQSSVIAWLYSFEKREDKKRQNVVLENIKRRMSRITPYECAVIMREMESSTPVWHRGRYAEDIRRFMLFSDLYSSYFSEHDKPAKRLVNAFLPQMFRDCLTAAEECIAGEYGSCENLISVQPDRDGEILAGGQRYVILECDTKNDGHLAFPCIFAKDLKNNEEFAYAPEVGALALTTRKKLGGAFISTINPDPESYETSVGILTKEQVEIFRDKAAETLKKFWQENVIKNKPFTVTVKPSGKMPMEADAALEYSRLAEELGRLHMARKAIEEKQESLKGQLESLVRAYAESNGAYLNDIQAPQGMVGMTRKRSVDMGEAERILQAMPEAANVIISKLEPDKKLMIQYLEEHGVSETLWKTPKIDPDLLLKFCEDNNINAPVYVNVSFSISTSKKSRELLEQAASDIQPAMEMLFNMEKQRDDLNDSPSISF